MRAERRVGELMQAQRETVGLAKGGRPYQSTGSQPDPVAPTLSDAGTVPADQVPNYRGFSAGLSVSVSIA